MPPLHSIVCGLLHPSQFEEFEPRTMDGMSGLERAQTARFDAIVLDVMLPGIDGLHVRRLRDNGIRTPILMLTARDSAPDIVRGLDGGGRTTI
jgi:DNA-binding response OmpR family regulator